MDVKLPEKCCDNPQRFVVAPVIGFECRNCGYRECRNGNEELLKEMAEALTNLLANPKSVNGWVGAAKSLQKYHEQAGDTNAE